MHQFDNPALLTEEGNFISEEWRRLAEILSDFNPYITLNYIPHKNRTSADTSKPYAICHCPPGKKPYVIMFADETDRPVEILAKLWIADTNRNNVMGQLQAKEKAEEAFRLHKQMEEMEENHDLFHYLITNRSPWITKHKRPDGKIVKIDTAIGRVIE